jgi:4a-hydroxytetrahydrobiopterin dehydratase
MSDLASRACVPCRGGIPPLTADQIAPLLSQLTGWTVVANHHLEKTYRFPDFVRALALVNRIGALAEAQGHHPDRSVGARSMSYSQKRMTKWRRQASAN